MSGSGLIDPVPDRLRDGAGDSAEVLAERHACLTVMHQIRARMVCLMRQDDEAVDSPAEIDPEDFAMEMRRMDAALEMVEQGIHRAGENGSDGS